LEPRALYGERENVEPGEESIIEFGKAETVREGSDVTLVALGQTVKVALDAEAAGSWSGDVIDLLSLMPWDKEAVLASVRRTGRLVVVEENQFTGGWGTEIASYVSSAGFGDLKSPVLRITAPDVPVPFGQELERRFLPSAEYVVQQVDALLADNRAPAPWWKEFL
jgi:pyruvate dehydrogenase E1 component beta subunit